MTRAYSQDLRDRLIASVLEEGLSRRAAARRYRIGEATAVRWLAAVSAGRRTLRRQGGKAVIDGRGFRRTRVGCWR